MQKITPFLWFDANAEEAVAFYTSVFKDSKVLATARYGEAGPGPKGSVMTMKFVLNGQEFIALNAGPHFQFNEAVSFVVNCETQQEVDDYWTKLTTGGKEVQCGWLKDKFGLSWQVVPRALLAMMLDKDTRKSQAVTKAFLQMKKFDIAALERAFEGEAV